MKRSMLWMAALPLAAVVVAGCNKTEGTGEPSAKSTTRPATSPGASGSGKAAPSSSTAERRGGRHSRGIAGMFFRAADRASLPDDKKAQVAKMEESLLSYDPTQRAEWKTFHADLIAGAKDGRIDTAKLTTDELALEKEMEAQRDKEADALNQLHGALDATQRKEVTAQIRQWQERREKEHPAAAPSASTSAAPGASQNAAHAEKWEQRHLERLTKDLDLDPAQQKSVGAILAKSEQTSFESMQAERKKHMDALLTAFEGDPFDAKAVIAKEMPGKMHERWDKHVQFLSQLVALLKPIQRDKLAANMEKGRWTINARGERTMGDAPQTEPRAHEEEDRP